MSFTQIIESIQAVSGVFLNLSPIGWVVVLVIVGLFTYGCFLRRQIRHYFQSERSEIRKCREHFEQIDDGESSAVQFDAITRVLWFDSLTKRAVHWLWKVRRQPNPDVNAIINALNRSFEYRTHTLRALPNILLLLGLFGTVIGIGGSIASLVPQIQQALFSTNPQELTTNLADTLQQMLTAFATTLAGIVTSLIIGNVARGAQKDQAKFQAEMHDFILAFVVPKFFPASLEVQLDDMRIVIGESHKYIDKVTSLMDKTSERFNTVFNKASETMTDNISQLASVSGALESSLSQLSNQVENSVTSLDQGAQEIKASTLELQRYHDDMRSAYLRLGELFTESREHTGKQIHDQLNKIDEVSQQYTTVTQHIIERVDIVAERLFATSASFDKAGEHYLRATNDSYLKIESGFDDIKNELKTMLSGHRGGLQEVSGALSTYSGQMSQLVSQLDPSLFPRDEWKSMRKILDDIFEALVAFQNGQSNSLSHIERSTEVLKEISVRLADYPNNNQFEEMFRETLKLLNNLEIHLARSDNEVLEPDINPFAR